MKNKFFVLFSILLVNTRLYAQDQYLEINNQCGEFNSPFTKVYAIDNRSDNQLLGYVQKGVMNRMTTIKFNGNLADSLGTFFVSRSASMQRKTIVLILNELFMHESDSGPGKLKLSIRLFAESRENRFVEFLTIDSIYLSHGMDVTKRLLRSVNERFCDIAKEAAQTKEVVTKLIPDYSLEELYKLDSLEKLNIPMYFTDKPKTGIYKDYYHFKMNTPDIDTEIVIDSSNAKRFKVYRVYKASNRKMKLDNEHVYAVSDGVKMLKVTSAGEYFEIKKKGLDFYYDRAGSYARQNNNTFPYYYPGGGLVGGAIAGAIAGGVNGIVSNDIIHLYRFRINHRKGNSIPVAIIKK